MAALGDLARSDCFQYSAALLFRVAAAHKAAVVQIGSKLQKGLRQVVLEFQVQLLRVKGGKTGRVHHLRAASQAIELHMAGGVPTAAQGIADLPYLDVILRVQGIEDAGLSHAGIPCKGG